VRLQISFFLPCYFSLSNSAHLKIISSEVIMKRIISLLCCIALAGCCQLSRQQRTNYPVANGYYFAPHLMPDVAPQMQFPGYWIDRASTPDALLLNLAQIDSLNAAIRATGLVRDVIALAHCDSLEHFHDAAWNHMQRKREMLAQRQLYEAYGTTLTPDEQASCLANLPRNTAEYHALKVDSLALFTCFTSEQMLPGNLFLSAKPYDDEFNALQNNGLDMGEPTFVLCGSRDGKWVYQINSFSAGWVPREHLLLLSRAQHINALPTAIVKQPYAEYWQHSDETGFIGVLRMGSTVYIDTTWHNTIHVRILRPQPSGMQTTYLRRDAITNTPQPLTRRNLLNAAFAWLHTPYGWGDTNQFVDCSKFIQCLYRLHGIIIPRNGRAQGSIAPNLLTQHAALSSQQCIQQYGIPGLTMLHMPGHIMLYVGCNNDEVYAIHVLYRYQEIEGKYITNRVPNRVVISTLRLSEGSTRGSYLQRLSAVLHPCP
jgi:hypothetical protein